MSVITVTWTDPTTLADGKTAIPANDFAMVEINASADGGKTYTLAGHVAPGVQTFAFEVDDSGTYSFILNAVDTQTPPTTSANSAVAQATIAPPPLQAIAAPTNVQATVTTP